MTKDRWLLIGKVLGSVIVAGAAVTILYFALLWWPRHQAAHLPKQVSDLDRFNAEDRTRQTAATIIGGIAVLLGASLTLRNVRAAEKSAETARIAAERNAETAQENLAIARQSMEKDAETAQKNIKIAGDKQLTDRFTAAVNNLSMEGPEKMATRLGGIYALERIAHDSPDDHWTVMEVLTAYVRDKRPVVNYEEQNTEASDVKTQQIIRAPTPTDIQATLAVIGRRDAKRDKGRKLDLHKVDLFRADLVEADLVEADLRGADLRGADLARANLERTRLVEAKLEGTYLVYCLSLTQQQLDAANQADAPTSLPSGLTSLGYPIPDPLPVPSA